MAEVATETSSSYSKAAAGVRRTFCSEDISVATSAVIGEEEQRKKKMGFRELCVGLVMMMILLKPISGRDAVLVLRSNATYQCNGLLGDCGIREELESELDLLMIDSTVIRILGS
ncbi:hypothetical protein Gotur_028805, partial [Gossypium turneri]